jgi:hypothetical protein
MKKRKCLPKKGKEEDQRRKRYRSTSKELKEVGLLVKQQGLKN